MKNLPDIDRVPLGRSILKNCRANASCVNYYVTLSINLPFFHGHSQVTGSAQSPHPAQAVHTPAAYCTAASPVLPTVPGCCRIRPPRLAYGVVFTGNSPKEKARNFSVHQEVSGFVLLELEIYCSIGFMVGNSSTSRMEALSVSSITRRSTPKPRPPVGGRPYSSAFT